MPLSIERISTLRRPAVAFHTPDLHKSLMKVCVISPKRSALSITIFRTIQLCNPERRESKGNEARNLVVRNLKILIILLIIEDAKDCQE